MGPGHGGLDADGFALTGPLLSWGECEALSGRYDDDRLFSSRVIKARHGFGRGEYRYYQYPLPPAVDDLRRRIYPSQAPLVN